MTNEETEFLKQAAQFLEHPSFLIRMTNLVGAPLEKSLKMLPEKAQTKIHDVVRKSLGKGLEVISRSIDLDPKSSFSDANLRSVKSGWIHSAASFGTGAVGGFFGLAALPIELPITTGVMLRSIANIANEFGHDLADPQVRLECLYVLSLGAKSSSDDAMDSAYWTSRVAFSELIHEASVFIARSTAAQLSRNLKDGSGPVLVRLIAQVASKFEIVVSEKAMAELVPVIGAVGGGVINAAFNQYFSDAARYHFGLRALEKKYGQNVVRQLYAGKDGV